MADLKVLLGADITSSVEQINKDIEVITKKISTKALPSVIINIDTRPLDKILKRIENLSSESNSTVRVPSDVSSVNKSLVSSNESANIDAVTVSAERLISAQSEIITQRERNASAIKKEEAAATQLQEKQAQQTNYSDKFLASLRNQISDIDTYTLKIKNLENSYARIGYTPPDFTGLKNSVAELQNVKLNSSNVQEYVIKVDELESAFRRASAQFQGFAKENTANAAIAQREKEVQSLIFRLEELYQTSKKLQSDPTGTTQYNSMMSNLQGGINTQADLINARKELDRLSNSWKENGLLAETWGEKVGKAFSKFGGWAIVASISTQVVRSFRQMIAETIKLDTALTELKKVTDETSDSYEKFMKRAAETAKSIGGTYADVVTATADFARLGYSIGQAEELAKAAIVYKNVGDGISNVSEASSSIISTMKAFSIEASNAMTIVNKFNEVGNNFAISSQGVGEALLRSASSLAAAGNTLDESIGIIVAMNNVVNKCHLMTISVKGRRRFRPSKDLLCC